MSSTDVVFFHFVVSFVKIALYVMLTVLIVAVLGVPMASIVAVIGSVGLAISLAVQGTLSNLASGIMILVFKPFREGDYVEADGVGGTVTDLGIFYTTLTTPDNKKVVIPNGNVTSNVLTNYSAKDTRRVEVKFNVDRSTDLDRAKGIVVSTLDGYDKILSDPAPFIRMTEVKDHAVVITVRVWCNRDEYWNVNFDLVENIYENFKKEGIEIPNPKMDVTVKDRK